MKNLIIFSFVFLLSFNIQGQKSNFPSYTPVKTSTYKSRGSNYYLKVAKLKAFTKVWAEIESRNWEYEDVLGNTVSSFIEGGKYYSSPGISLMVLNMNGNYYLYRDVPFDIWKGFKNSFSLGTYYNQYIRGKYLIQSTE